MEGGWGMSLDDVVADLINVTADDDELVGLLEFAVGAARLGLGVEDLKRFAVCSNEHFYDWLELSDVRRGLDEIARKLTLVGARWGDADE